MANNHNRSSEFVNEITPMRAARSHPEVYWQVVKLASSKNIPPDAVNWAYVYEIHYNFEHPETATVANLALSALYEFPEGSRNGFDGVQKKFPLDKTPLRVKNQLSWFRQQDEIPD